MLVYLRLAGAEKEFERGSITDWHPVKVCSLKQQDYVMQWIKRGYVASEDGIVVNLFSVFSYFVLYH